MKQLSLVRQLSLIVFVALLFAGIVESRTMCWAKNHGHVSGRLITPSGPLTAGTLAFFHADRGSDPADSSILRIPDRTALVDEQGRFEVDIQHGRYLLGYFPGHQKTHPGLPDKNFETFLAGISELERYTLHVTVPQIDIGDISFYPYTKTTAGPSFNVHGTVRTDTGKPVSGITIIAKSDYNSLRPQYISMKTDRSGVYSLTLPPGSYYLFARHRLKKFGRPVTGEYFGIWGVRGAAGEFGRFPITKNQDISMHGEVGETITDADITVYRIPDPTTQEEVLRSGGKR